MSAIENKQLLQRVFADLSKGNSQSLLDIMADDFCWTVKGTTKWSRIYSGKQVVLTKLLQPLAAQFETQYTNTAHRFIAEDDFVVVECRGNAMTKNGEPYNNTYCFVCRLENQKLKELTEYCDTELVATVLDR